MKFHVFLRRRNRFTFGIMRTSAKISHSPPRRSRAAPSRNIEFEESVI
jgi:hypothetical protein